MSEHQAMAADVAASAPPRKKWWQRMLAPAVLGAILGAIPTGIDLYKSFDYDVGYSEVRHAEEQRRLWMKNFACAQSMTYQQVRTEEGIEVQVGACPNGDVLIEVQAPNSTRLLEWISLNRIRSASAVSSLSLVGTAYAAAQPGYKSSQKVSPHSKIAQASVMCQAMQGSSRIIRIVNDNGTCFREEIEVLKGKVVKREQVACDAKCS